MESFGHYIRRLRIDSGLNQTQLAAKIGLDSAGLSKIENSKKELKATKLLILSKALKVDVEELKEQYLSQKFAEDCFKYKCSESVFKLAEEKARYYKSVKVKQGNLNL
ncbi:transcriptional regulator with XRE-family HTH domain [Pedobacter cryoconitis]|uniref:helix-turn-helix domain-containing protein n=1 Tax=Pedobacter cryoconitis TaxID=188932 RepID=UPI0016135F83|nr:helix-turn-helix transcriptional regulator [Pedobacter cryoconitis]MBB6273562.1 transcriptional regulator with XRE-family HTH domain [Pedobacter cryoconitis]